MNECTSCMHQMHVHTYMHTCIHTYIMYMLTLHVCMYAHTRLHTCHTTIFMDRRASPMIAFHEVNIELIYYILVSHTVYIHVFIC